MPGFKFCKPPSLTVNLVSSSAKSAPATWHTLRQEWSASWRREAEGDSVATTFDLSGKSAEPTRITAHVVDAHIRGALTNGVARAQIAEIFLQVAIYVGVPAAVDSFRIAQETFTEMEAGGGA
jgi:hypothetical protein